MEDVIVLSSDSEQDSSSSNLSLAMDIEPVEIKIENTSETIVPKDNET